MNTPALERLRAFRQAIYTCDGYVRRVKHDEIAEAVGENLRKILGTPAHPNPKGGRNISLS